MGAAAWANAIDATEFNPFLVDLAQAVGNEPTHPAAVRYWLSACGAGDSPWRAWDANIDALERVGKLWHVMHKAADVFGAGHLLPKLARFVCDRWQAAMNEEIGMAWIENPVTRALVLSERAHDLVGLMHAGVRVTGSADPFALRRAAKHWLIAAFVS